VPGKPNPNKQFLTSTQLRQIRRQVRYVDRSPDEARRHFSTTCLHRALSLLGSPSNRVLRARRCREARRSNVMAMRRTNLWLSAHLDKGSLLVGILLGDGAQPRHGQRQLPPTVDVAGAAEKIMKALVKASIPRRSQKRVRAEATT